MSGEPDPIGKCCACDDRPADPSLVALLNLRGPWPGEGWGCTCGLPYDGAVALLCRECADAGRTPVFAAGRRGERIPVAPLRQQVDLNAHKGPGCKVGFADIDLGDESHSYAAVFGDAHAINRTPAQRLADYLSRCAQEGRRPGLTEQEFRDGFPRKPGRYWAYDPISFTVEVEMLLPPDSEIMTFTVRRVDGTPMVDAPILTAADAAMHYVWVVTGVDRRLRRGPLPDHQFRCADGSHVLTFNLARFTSPTPAPTKGRL